MRQEGEKLGWMLKAGSILKIKPVLIRLLIDSPWRWLLSVHMRNGDDRKSWGVTWISWPPEPGWYECHKSNFIVGVKFGSPGISSGWEEHESVLVTLIEEGQVTDLAPLWMSQEETVILRFCRSLGEGPGNFLICPIPWYQFSRSGVSLCLGMPLFMVTATQKMPHWKHT